MAAESYNGTQGQSQGTTYDFHVKCLIWGVSSASKQSPSPPVEWPPEAEDLKATSEQQ